MTSLDREKRIRNYRRAIASMMAALHGMDVQLQEELGERPTGPKARWVTLDVAAELSGEKPDTIRFWCRDAERNPGLGRREGRRWMVDMTLLNERLKPK